MKIESGIAIPPPYFRKWGKIAKKMKIGDSVLVFTRNDSHCLITAIFKTGYRACERKIDGEGIRVWKVGHK